MDFGFVGYDRVISHKGEGSVKLENYDLVYDCDVQSSYEVPLEDLYFIFNERRPEDFEGHSMSVSDVVWIDGTYWYCDDIGWKKLDWGN